MFIKFQKIIKKYLKKQENQKENKEFLLDAMKVDAFLLDYLSEKLKNDHEIVKAAVENNGLSLQFASTELKNNKALVLAAIQENRLALEQASEELKNNRTFILNCLDNDYISINLDNVGEPLKEDAEIVLKAVAKDKSNIEHANGEIKTLLTELRDIKDKKKFREKRQETIEYLQSDEDLTDLLTNALYTINHETLRSYSSDSDD